MAKKFIINIKNLVLCSDTGQVDKESEERFERVAEKIASSSATVSYTSILQFLQSKKDLFSAEAVTMGLGNEPAHKLAMTQQAIGVIEHLMTIDVEK